MQRTSGYLALTHSRESSKPEWDRENGNLETIDSAVTALQQSSGGANARQVGPEIPSGAVDGNNKTFVLANTPGPQSSAWGFWNNGAVFQPGDFTLSGAVVTMAVAPNGGQ